MVLTPLRVYAQRDSPVTTASMISMSVTPNLVQMEAPVRIAMAPTSVPAYMDTLGSTVR